MKHVRQASFGLLIALASAAAIAAPGSKGFLPASAIDVPSLLPTPVAHGSPEERAELDAVLAAQAMRTPADVARAKSEEKFDVFAFADVLGAGFTAERCPKTAAMFKMLAADGKAFSKVGKEHFNRRRPPFIDDRIKPAVTLEDEGSYPSSHSARGQLYAEVLATILPEKKDALLARGQQIGFDRLLGGVHYPSDITAGRVLGHAIFGRLMNDATFKTQLDGVKAELTEQMGQLKVSSR